AALIVRAAQAISSEIDLPRILERLVTLVLENAGAERGALLLGRDEQLFVEATFGAEPGDFSLGRSADLASRTDLPKSVLLYVARVREAVAIDDVRTDTQFAGDPYIAAHGPRSLLCLPLLYKRCVSGVLYLEHRHTAGAFNAARIELLGLLSSQAAISIENARCLELERAARAAAEDAEGRAAFLADATALLSESLDVELGLARFAKLAVRGLSDWCVIHLIHEGQSR